MDLVRPARILIVDDDQIILDSFSSCFRSMGLQVLGLNDPIESLRVIQEEDFDLVYLDLRMQPYDGFHILQEIKKVKPNLIVIIISGFGEIDDAIEAVDRGAYHIIKKPIDFKDLQFFTKKALEFHRIQQELNKLKEEVRSHTHLEKFITKNANFVNVIKLAGQIADSEINVLITGESGTGKELMAEFIHSNSHRSKAPLVKVNCAAIPENLLESELFGHVKGAFTGAVKDRVGRFEMAHGGIIFLDEIGEMPLSFQVKLLRVLQSKEFESVGDSRTKQVDVRVIAATNTNLEEAIKEKTFREDLYYRLNGVNLHLLPLRERPEDIPLLVRHFMEVYASEENRNPEITSEAVGYLKAYRWSGNVRELQNVIHRAVVLSRNGKINPSHLPAEITTNTQKNEDLITLEELEKLHIKKVLQFSTDYKEAAKILGIDLTTLWRKRKKYSIL